MFKKIFKKNNKENINNKNILITALLIHAAKIDDNYTEVEKEIITNVAIIGIGSLIIGIVFLLTSILLYSLVSVVREHNTR